MQGDSVLFFFRNGLCFRTGRIVFGPDTCRAGDFAAGASRCVAARGSDR